MYECFPPFWYVQMPVDEECVPTDSHHVPAKPDFRHESDDRDDPHVQSPVVERLGTVQESLVLSRSDETVVPKLSDCLRRSEVQFGCQSSDKREDDRVPPQ